MKMILIVLLLCMGLYALEKPLTNIKANIRQVGDIVEVKVRFINEMIGIEEGKKKQIKPNFISHITARVDEAVVYDASTSSSLSKYPTIKFQFSATSKHEKIEFIVIDNNGKQTNKSIKIQGSLDVKKNVGIIEEIKNFSVKDFKKSNPKAWKAATQEEAVNQLYGHVEAMNEGIHLTLPVLALHSETIPINIESDIDLESIAIFKDTKPHALIAVINVPFKAIINYDLEVKSINVDFITITIIGKSRDKKFYKVAKRIPVCKSDCGGQ